MNIVKEKLPAMFELARNPSDGARVELAGMLADVFLTRDASLTLREEEMVNELIDQLLLCGSSAVRARLVEKFADAARMPARIATALARDTIEVARAVLVTNPNLTDKDLIDVVAMKSSEHAVAVASRAEISEVVADALVTTGDVRVMQVVVENLGAHLTPMAVQVVVQAARYAAVLREPILHRSEMDVGSALKLYWWVEQDLRRYTLKRFGIGAGQVDQALSSTISTLLEANAHEKANDGVMMRVADWIESHQALTPQVLPQVLRMGHFRLFNMLLARLSKLTLSLVDMIMQEAGGRGLAAICRAAGIDKPGFVSLFLLSRGGRPGDQVVHPRELSHALLTFDRMSPAIAKDLLHTWGVNPEYLAKHAEELAREERIAVY